MINYKKYIKIAIERQNYQLEDMKDCINRLWIDNKQFKKNEKRLLQLMEGV